MTIRVPAFEKKAEEKIRRWIDASHAQQRLADRDVQQSVGPYITISRETGAGGSAIARKIEERFSWDVMDKEIIEYMIEQYGTPRSLVELVDEKHSSWISDTFTSWIGGLGFSSTAYTHRLNQLFLLAAHHGNVVIVGRGARFFLPNDRGLSVRVLAPLDFRVRQVLMQKGLTEKEARKFVIESDHEREAYVKEHFHQRSADPHMYDLVINVEKLTQQDVVNVIVDAAEAWMKKSGVSV